MKIEINTDVANNIAKLCLNEERADMHFRVVVNKPAADGGTIETKRFPGHRFVISLSTSPVFQMMLSNGWLACEKDIEVPDVDADSFEKMLVYIYKGTVDLEGMDVGQILALHSAARKYEVLALLKRCSEEIVGKFLQPATVLTMLEYSLGTVEEEEFKKSALSWIACNTKEVLESEAFLHHANDACVAAVLRLGELSVREVDIFEAVYKRAKVNCELRAEAASPTNIRSAMGPLIDLIRFSAMTKDEFNRVVGVFSRRETALHRMELREFSAVEVELFQLLYNRAKARCELRCEETSPKNIRSAMGPLLGLVRFSAMTADEFNCVVVPTSVLSDEETAQIHGKMPRTLITQATGTLFHSLNHPNDYEPAVFRVGVHRFIFSIQPDILPAASSSAAAGGNGQSQRVLRCEVSPLPAADSSLSPAFRYESRVFYRPFGTINTSSGEEVKGGPTTFDIPCEELRSCDKLRESKSVFDGTFVIWAAVTVFTSQ